jgi:glycerol-3-phosphate acyltransferase PlsY
MLTILPMVVAYLLGAIPFGLLIGKLFGETDIRKVGSGNPGATNVWRLLGFKAAIWVFIGDIGKGALAVWMAQYWVGNIGIQGLSADMFYVLCALVVIVGHVFPVYTGFKGGKGVNTALGAMIMLLPFESLVSLMVFAIVLLVFRYVSLGSMIAAISFAVTILLEKYAMHKDVALIYVFLSALLALLIVVTHRQNITRLLTGTENRFSMSSKSKGGGVDG